MRSSATVDFSRRRLFRGDLAGRRLPMRPPWALSEAGFSRGCDRCGDCVQVCPERVIRVGSGGFPEMDFSERGCSLCGDCLTACRGKALTSGPEEMPPWSWKAEVTGSCLANQGVVCRSCGEVCDERAIRFELRVGGAALPRLDSDLCNGCGWCVGVCPVKAVAVGPVEQKAAPAAAANVAENAEHQEFEAR